MEGDALPPAPERGSKGMLLFALPWKGRAPSRKPAKDIFEYKQQGVLLPKKRRRDGGVSEAVVILKI